MDRRQVKLVRTPDRLACVLLLLPVRISTATSSPNLPRHKLRKLRICSCLACVYQVMNARGKSGEHERCARVARGDSRVQL